WGDPSHAKDDEDGSRYWDAMLDSWHRDFGDRFDTRHWANASGDRVSSTLFDMATPRNSTLFSEAVVRVRDDFDSQRITWDGHPHGAPHRRPAAARPAGPPRPRPPAAPAARAPRTAPARGGAPRRGGAGAGGAPRVAPHRARGAPARGRQSARALAAAPRSG